MNLKFRPRVPNDEWYERRFDKGRGSLIHLNKSTETNLANAKRRNANRAFAESLLRKLDAQ